MRIHHYIPILTILFICQITKGINIYDLNEPGDFINLVNKIEILEDKGGSLDLDGVINKRFTPHVGQQINFQFSKSVFWLKFAICNNSPEDIILDIGNHFIEYVDIYYAPTDSIHYKHLSIGALGAESIKAKKHLSFWKMDLTQGRPYTFYIRIKSSTPLRVPMEIRTMSNHNYHQSQIANITWYFYGVASFLFLFGLFVYFSLKQKIYLYFILSLIFLIAYQFGYDNFYPAISIAGEADFLLKKMNGTIMWSVFFYIMFFSEFIKSNTIPSWAYHILNLAKAISLLTCFTFLIYFRLGNILAYIIAPFIWVVLTIVTISLYLKGLKFIRFFALATIVLLGAVFLHVTTNLGYMPSSSAIPQLAIKLGYLGQVFFFTIAITDRYFLYQKNFTSVLEQKVEERTTELEQTLSNLKTRKQQLFQSEKMASIGILSTGVAHEINTPLNAINCGINIFESYQYDTDVSEEERSKNIDVSLQMMKDGLEKTTNIVNSLMNFSHVDVSKLEKTDINKLIDQTLLFLKSRTPSNLSILRQYTPIIYAPVYRDRFHQVIFNVLINAIEAIAHQEGTITIRTSNKRIKQKNFVQIDIENSHSKIDDAALLKIFDPFYTTKTKGHNVGLGLSISYNFIKDHKGEIFVRNLTSGVVFEIQIPIKPKQSETS